MIIYTPNNGLEKNNLHYKNICKISGPVEKKASDEDITEDKKMPGIRGQTWGEKLSVASILQLKTRQQFQLVTELIKN